MNKQSVISASDVKPNFSKVKEVWQEMLSQYYDDQNKLREFKKRKLAIKDEIIKLQNELDKIFS